MDGKLENSYESGITAADLSNEVHLTTGRYENGDDGDHRYFQGSVDEVIIYDRALNECEIEILYEGNKYRER